MTSSNVAVGREFDSMEESKQFMYRWAVDNSMSFTVQRLEPTRWILVCRKPDICSFRLRLSKEKHSSSVRISKYTPHSCPSNTHHKWRKKNSIKLLTANNLVISAVAEDKQLKPKTIQTLERHHHGNKVSYLAGWRAKEKVLKNLYGDETESFQMIPSLLKALRGNKKNPDCHYQLQIHPGSQKFERCYIIPVATIKAFKHCRNMVTIDGTHTFV